MAMKAKCDSCGKETLLRDWRRRGWSYHAGPPLKYFCADAQCQAAHQTFVASTKISAKRTP
jgi:hypothetical protein